MKNNTWDSMSGMPGEQVAGPDAWVDMGRHQSGALLMAGKDSNDITAAGSAFIMKAPDDNASFCEAVAGDNCFIF